jgi:hypothetical protein
MDDGEEYDRSDAHLDQLYEGIRQRLHLDGQPRIGDAEQQTGYDPYVGWDDGAYRASNDAAVSIVPPKIPYGGFSPVRLQSWPVRWSLP